MAFQMCAAVCCGFLSVLFLLKAPLVLCLFDVFVAMMPVVWVSHRVAPMRSSLLFYHVSLEVEWHDGGVARPYGHENSQLFRP